VLHERFAKLIQRQLLRRSVVAHCAKPSVREPPTVGSCPLDSRPSVSSQQTPEPPQGKKCNTQSYLFFRVCLSLLSGQTRPFTRRAPWRRRLGSAADPRPRSSRARMTS
jgi:hypothetical protein